MLAFLWANTPVIGVSAVMVSMGITLTFSDFATVLKRPKPIFVGFCGQTFVPGCVVFLLATLFRLPEAIALGMMVIAACPGGATSNAFSVMARGDAALSISLTAVSSIFAFLNVPTNIGIGTARVGGPDSGVTLNFAQTALKVFSNTVVPLALGMGLRRLLPVFSVKLVKPLLYGGLGVLILPTFTFFDQFGALLTGRDTLAASTAILLNVCAMLAGLALGRICRLPPMQARTLSIEVGIQNYGLVLIIIVTYLEDLRLLLPAIFYLPSMYLTGFFMVLLANKFSGSDHLRTDKKAPQHS
ncbi:MAG: bile acid:sodium symporter [Pseudomonadota bacterium]